jgi:hypothetical protein
MLCCSHIKRRSLIVICQPQRHPVRQARLRSTAVLRSQNGNDLFLSPNSLLHWIPHQKSSMFVCLLARLLAYSPAQKLVPSAGCGSFLLAGAAMYRRISISTVSMVKSRFQDAMLGSLERSTCAGKELGQLGVLHAVLPFLV